MPIVFVPPLMRTLTNGTERVEVPGTNVRQVLEALDAQFPGVKARLCLGDELLPGMAVAVDGHMSSLGRASIAVRWVSDSSQSSPGIPLHLVRGVNC